MEQRNLIIAVVASLVILLGFQFLYEMPRLRQQQAMHATTAGSTAATTGGEASTPLPQAPTTGTVGQPGAAQASPLDRDAILATSPRIPIASDRLLGSINLTGGRFDDLILADYRETVAPNSPRITLLSPSGTAQPYFAEFGWVSETPGVAVPDAKTLWRSEAGGKLTTAQPVTLTWDNGAGLTFERTYAVDKNFMFTLTDKVTNHSANPVVLHPYGLVVRVGTPVVAGFYILHEGMIGVVDATLREIKYKDIKKEGTESAPSTGGWLGFTDKYWLVSLVPDQKAKLTTRFAYTAPASIDHYQTDYLGDAVSLAPGASTSTATRLFAGAKEVKLLDAYRDDLGIPLFDRAVDFGWFYFLTKPIFYALDYAYGVLGNFGLAILLLTVCIKLLLFPLANKSYKAMSRMKALQPEMTKLRERFGEDRQRLNQEMMALYKREKVNPAAGCLPVVVQIPVFFALYKVLFVTIEMRHAPFFGWIHDLSSPDPTTIFNGFGLIDWTPPQTLMIGAWPLIMGVTMFLQQRLNPTPPDPVQAKVFMALPVVFTFMLAHFPAGLVIYWAWNNLLSMTQQWVIMRRMGVKA